MRVYVDKAGGDVGACGIGDLLSVQPQVCADLRDPATTDPDVCGPGGRARAVRDETTAYEKIAQRALLG